MAKFGIPFERAALIVALLPVWALGQTKPALSAFEAASVRPIAPNDLQGSSFEFRPGSLKITNGTLIGIIESAFEVRDFQIAGTPRWANSDRYNIVATSASGDPATKAGDQPVEISLTRQRLRNLLSERFQFKAHYETRDLPIYVLTAAKGGPALKDGKPSNTPAGIQKVCGQMTGMSASMSNLATYLSRELDRIVEDRSGLSGRYDFHLDWTPHPDRCPVFTIDAGNPVAWPSLFTALREQLGLKLESTRGPVQVIVIDSVKKPDDNWNFR
jgi:uncharacterized protein (TIGR03435 family)